LHDINWKKRDRLPGEEFLAKGKGVKKVRCRRLTQRKARATANRKKRGKERDRRRKQVEREKAGRIFPPRGKKTFHPVTGGGKVHAIFYCGSQERNGVGKVHLSLPGEEENLF